MPSQNWKAGFAARVLLRFYNLGTDISCFFSIKWLTYWVVYSTISTVEILFASIFGWIPLYYEAKLVFVIWLQAPKTKVLSPR